jgi:hypothetical protein
MTLLMTQEEMQLYLLALQVKAGDQPEEVDDESIIESIMDGDCQSIKKKF